MVAPKLNETERYSALDGFEVVYCPVVAAATGIPTRAEINAGTDLTTEIEGTEGWDVEATEITMPSLRRFEGSHPGKLTVPPSQLRIYADRGGDDVADILPDGTLGSIIIFPTGDRVATPAARMNIWPIRVNRLTELNSTEAVSMYRVMFTHRTLPIERVPVPAPAV